MLREMRDAAGDSGEFYTPRPVVRFMVEATSPQLGETVLDPACGTGGFLVEAYEHLAAQCTTVQERETLQRRSIIGQEAKPLSYMLGQMNLLLHGLEHPDIRYGNTLAVKLSEIGDGERVDVILSNPPFGGEEETSIRQNFPADLQTSETALLFLQYIMRKLRRPVGKHGAGRAAVVVPDGILSQEGVAARVRQKVVEDMRLSFVIRLPRGVFEPYTKSSTSVLFFDRVDSTKETWFYEVPVREDVKAYSLTQPFRFEELLPVLEWMKYPVKTDRSWSVEVAELAKGNFSLIQQNPSRVGGLQFPPPGATLPRLLDSLGSVHEWLEEAGKTWEGLEAAVAASPLVAVGDLLTLRRRDEVLMGDQDYPVLAMSWYAKGLYVKHVKNGDEIKAEKLYRVEAGDFVYNRLFAWKGSFAEATPENSGCYVSNEFPTFEITDRRIVPGYLWAYFGQPRLWDFIESLSTGTTSTSRLRLKEERFLKFEIPLPDGDVQRKLAELWSSSLRVERQLKALTSLQQQVLPGVLERVVPWNTTTPAAAVESDASASA